MAKIDSFEYALGHIFSFESFFYLELPNTAMNLPNFLYGSCSYGPPCEIHTLYAGKILIWRNFGHLRPKFGHFLAKIDSFESF